MQTDIFNSYIYGEKGITHPDKTFGEESRIRPSAPLA
jgi:hypothetical protein